MPIAPSERNFKEQLVKWAKTSDHQSIALVKIITNLEELQAFAQELEKKQAENPSYQPGPTDAPFPRYEWILRRHSQVGRNQYEAVELGSAPTEEKGLELFHAFSLAAGGSMETL